MTNNNIAIQGLVFGDESKGAVTHRFSKNYDYVIRTAGGNNCGHVIYIDGKKFVHNFIPTVDFRSKHTKAILGSNMVINLEGLFEEIKNLSKTFHDAPSRIIVDPYAFLITNEHIEDDKKLNGSIGTTNKGIGPAYISKHSRKGIRLIDVIDSDPYAKELKNIGVTFKASYEMLPLLYGKRCVFEGAQGILLDVNLGTYPYVTSTDISIASIVSCGFASIMPNKVYGVTKAYSTRVGNGPFSTEIFGEEAEKLRSKGSEFGSVTGRPRRIGWMDLPALKYACDVGGITDIIVTKLDVLSDYGLIKVCHQYQEPLLGIKQLDGKPLYIDLLSWGNDFKFTQDKNLIKFLNYISSYTGKNISHITFGVGEEDIKELI